MVIIGIDPHKRTHTASALDPATHRVLASLQVDATLAGYRQLLRWATRFEARRWAVENARGLGRHLAQWLVAREEQVEDVPDDRPAVDLDQRLRHRVARAAEALAEAGHRDDDLHGPRPTDATMPR